VVRGNKSKSRRRRRTLSFRAIDGITTKRKYLHRYANKSESTRNSRDILLTFLSFDAPCTRFSYTPFQYNIYGHVENDYVKEGGRGKWETHYYFDAAARHVSSGWRGSMRSRTNPLTIFKYSPIERRRSSEM